MLASEPWQGARRILVIRLGALGDVVRTRFAFSGLRARFPDARIDWLVEDRAAPGLETIVGLDGVVSVPRRIRSARHPVAGARALSALIAELRAGSYDLSVDFHSIFKSAFLARAARIPLRVGYGAAAREGASRLMTHRVDLADDHISRFERNAALVRFLGGAVPDRPPPLELPADAEAGLAGLPSPYAVIHPGTSETTRYKRWDAERFASVAGALYRERGIASVVTWGPVPGERECAEQVVAAAGEGVVISPQTKNIASVLALYANARVFVGSDSGPLHLAALVGLPIVAVFGPTDPVENAPFSGVPSRVVRQDVGCNPCREGCPARSCMAAIAAEPVAEAALELAALGPRGA